MYIYIGTIHLIEIEHTDLKKHHDKTNIIARFNRNLKSDICIVLEHITYRYIF